MASSEFVETLLTRIGISCHAYYPVCLNPGRMVIIPSCREVI